MSTTETIETVTLYRPVGQRELELIQDSGVFPPRLDIQPIFYPVLTFEYAEKIARDWNTRDAASGNIGYVTRFEVRKSYLDGFEVQEAGGRDHLEYWIPAEELSNFNSNIISGIEVVARYEPT